MESPLRPAGSLLIQYARYHRDRRNIALHLIGIPLIIFAICALLSRPQFLVAGLLLTPAWLLWAATTFWYMTRGNLMLGIAVSLLTALLTLMAHRAAGGETAHWLAWGVGAFIAGWIIQGIGHYYEGRKPAFVDDIIGLLSGPMFVTAELLFAMGWSSGLKAEIERKAGATVKRELRHRN